jgi:hypothetical protein
MSGSSVKAIRAMVLAGLAACVVPTGTAHAQFRPWPQYAPWWGYHAPARHKHRHRKPQASKQEPARAASGPLQIIVSIADQRVSVYDNGALIARSAASTGVPRHPTPLGVFGVIDKKRWHRSNLYSAAPMPFMQRITWSGIALHAGVVPGHPASHGCIRLKQDFAVRLWHLTRLGTRVIIVANDVQPVEIANPRLFTAKQNAAFDPAESRAAVADDPVMTAEAYRPPDADAQHVATLEAQGSRVAAIAPRKVVPISVFVSRKSSRLYVRQGFTPLFDIPVTIRDPEQPLGTHVFAAIGLRTDPALRWTVTSMPENSPRAPEAVKQRTPGRQIAQGTPSSPDKANAALDRIEIPQHVVEHINQRLTPGASLIVSDHGISPETGNGTDFIVVTR